MIIRQITGAEELGLFCRIPYVINDELADDLAQGRRRPEWMWVALRGEELVGRAAWWGRPDEHDPLVLDVFDFDVLDEGVELLKTAMAELGCRVEYGRYIPPGWREDPQARRVVEERIAAVQQLGGELFVERLRLEWRPGTPVAEPDPRLVFRPVQGREELVGLMTRVLEGTLDAHSLEDLATLPPAEAAAKHFDEEFAGYASPREWWQVATLPDGEPVGFVVAARNTYNPVIAYIAVLPEHRGHGYIDAILAQGTRTLVEEGVPRIRAATDVGNVPMAKAFERAGYINFERAINMIWP